MAQGDKNLPVKLVVVEATKIDGKHVEVGEVLNNVPTDLAFELGGSGKVRAWTKELEADTKAQAKAEKAAAEARAAQQQAGLLGGGAQTIDYSAIIKQAVSEGIAAGVAALTAVPADPAPAENTGA